MKHTACLSGKKRSRTARLLLLVVFLRLMMGRTTQCSVFPVLSPETKDRYQRRFFLCFLIRCDPIQPMTRATVSVKSHLSASTMLGSVIPKTFASVYNYLNAHCTEELGIYHLTGFKMGDWDQIFSVWQPGQYRPPVIKPLPVKHPARIDEFPLGRAELSLELPAQEGGILNTEEVLAHSSWSASYSNLC